MMENIMESSKRGYPDDDCLILLRDEIEKRNKLVLKSLK